MGAFRALKVDVIRGLLLILVLTHFSNWMGGRLFVYLW